MPETEEIFTTTLKDVQETAKEFGRIVVDLPQEGQIIVLDDHIIGEGFIKQFTRDPLGYTQARRWAVRMDDADEEVSLSYEQLAEERRRFLDRK